jgi:hypothetical protein
MKAANTAGNLISGNVLRLLAVGDLQKLLYSMFWSRDFFTSFGLAVLNILIRSPNVEIHFVSYLI